MTNSGHCGFSSLRLGANWSVGDDNWMPRHSLLFQLGTRRLRQKLTISGQLHAILVVKLDGKALGMVQLVDKGEGLEAWRQLKLECDGKSGNRQAALLRRNLIPRAGWEADARDGRSVAESLIRWEKTISFYRTARSGHLRWHLSCYGAGTHA